MKQKVPFNTSGNIQHECGLAMVRLLKPLLYYERTYGDATWGLNATCLLMKQQNNRGQDGAGLAVLKFDMPPGYRYQNCIRFCGKLAIDQVATHVCHDMVANEKLLSLSADERLVLQKKQYAFLGEVYLGHVRYGTYGKNDVTRCQPYLFEHNIPSKSFALAGNFNMTNADELFDELIQSGLVLRYKNDTFIMLETIGFQLEQEHAYVSSHIQSRSKLQHSKQALMNQIAKEIDLVRVLRATAAKWDGGYVFGGMIGNGDLFVCRDPAGIRPGFYYKNEDVFAVASERAALCTVFDVDPEQVKSIKPGHVTILRKDGFFEQCRFTPAVPIKECMFERIYFSRPNDFAIYKERKQLGSNLAERVLDALNWDVEHVIFTFVPNSSKPAFFGLITRIKALLREKYIKDLWKKYDQGSITIEDIRSIVKTSLRADQLVYKNQTLRTFIHEGETRSNIIARSYNITKGIVQQTDILVAVEDSIVRGSTLRNSIIQQLICLNPKRIIIVSSAPPILYPDCYGIDMSDIGTFIAFQAAVQLTHEHGNSALLKQLKRECYEQLKKDPQQMTNVITQLYGQFTLEELQDKIARLVYPEDTTWKGQIKIIYQTIEGLHQAIPNHTGDWYFTGNYPTPGGYKVINTSFLNWCAGLQKRAY